MNLLHETIYDALNERYQPIPAFIQERVEQELVQAERYHRQEEILAFAHVLRHLKDHNIPYWLRGSTASCVFFYVMGLVRCNPLPAHYHCPHCKRTVLADESADGFDLPPRSCACGQPMEGDGHNIPAETFWDIFPPATVEDTSAQMLHVDIPACHLAIVVAMLQEQLPQMAPKESGSITFYIGRIAVVPIITATRYIKETPTRPVNFGKTLRWTGYSMSTIHDTTFQSVMDCHSPVFRDGVHQLFITLGATYEEASLAANLAYRRLPLPEHLLSMLSEELVEHFKKVAYLFPKAHCVEMLLYRGATEDVDEYPLLDTSYDAQLETIPHFKLHPEYLPFVGRNYQENKVLLVGESHYVKGEDVGDLAQWYHTSTEALFAPLGNEHQHYRHWFNTRGVVKNFAFHENSKSYTMFSNPMKSIIEVGTSSATQTHAMTHVAFCNYYQKPSLEAGATVENTEENQQNSKAIFQQILAILQPKMVVFLSRKAYQAFGETAPNIYVTDHPTSSWWHRRGKMEFQKFLQSNSMTLVDTVEPQDERLWLLERLVCDFENALQQRGIEYRAVPSHQLAIWLKEKSTPITLVTVGDMSICIDHRIYCQHQNGLWEHLHIEGGETLDYVPNFRKNQWAYRQLFDPNIRNSFVEKSIKDFIR
ncbi:MAG: hypothetical protein SNI70_03715 [Rikenellaceae bacterium]